MIIKKCNGLRGFLIPASVSVWVSCVSGANAWQQEYIAIDTKSNTSERYTWDSDHQPRYEDILAERMKSSETPGGAGVKPGAGAAGQRPRPEHWLELSAGKRRNLRAGGQPAQRRHRADGEKRRRGGLR